MKKKYIFFGLLFGALAIAAGETQFPSGIKTTAITGTGTGTFGQVIDSGATATTVPYLNGSKQLTSSAVTPTELGYLSGVTSSIQTQFGTVPTSIGNFNNSSTAKGLDITAGVLTLHAGDGSNPGAITTGSQTIAGIKTLSSQPIISSLTASLPVFSDGSKGLVSNTMTGTGDVVMSSGATLVGPALGTPTALVGTNITGTAAGLTSGAATALAANPADCAANTYANTIAANGDLTCASITNASTTGASAATASTLLLRDSNGAAALNRLSHGYRTVATAAAITTLAGSDPGTIYLTGSTTQTVKLPATNGSGMFGLGDQFVIHNTSSGALTIQDSAAGAVTTEAAASVCQFTVTAVASPGTWDSFCTVVNAGGGTVSSVAMTVPSFLSVAGSPVTSSGTLALTLSGTGLPAANGGTGGSSAASTGLAHVSSGTWSYAAADLASADVTGLLTNAKGGTGGSSASSTGLAHVSSGTWSYSAADLASSDVTGTLTVGKGGTGLANPTSHNLLVGNGSSAVNTIAPSTARNVLISDGTDFTSRALVAADIAGAQPTHTTASITSNTKTPTGSARYHSMTNNSVSLVAGTWLLTSTCDFSSSGSTIYSDVLCGWYAANGSDNATPPTALSTLGTITGYFFTELAIGAIANFTMSGPTIYFTNSGTQTVFLVPYSNETTAGNGRVTVYGLATKIAP